MGVKNQVGSGDVGIKGLLFMVSEKGLVLAGGSPDSFQMVFAFSCYS